MEYVYRTKGVCPSKIKIEVDGDTVGKVEFCGGCNGNGKGIAALVKGMKVQEVIARCKDITCGSKGTSCPAQLAKALAEITEK